MKNHRLILGVLFAVTAVFPFSAIRATDYYVDSATGNDASDGESPEKAWKSLDRVNDAKLLPGDAVLFRSGDLWRGSLRCQNGEEGKPIRYSSYGEGQKPVILASVDLSSPDAWEPVDGQVNIWKTRSDRVVGETPDLKFASGNWSLWTEKGGKGKIALADFDGQMGRQINCEKSGSGSDAFQVIASGFPVKRGTSILFRFRAKANKPFTLKNVTLNKSGFPWSGYASSVPSELAIGEDWADYEIRFCPNATDNAARMTFFLGALLPDDLEFSLIPLGTTLQEIDSLGITCDVGNIILTKRDASGDAVKTGVLADSSLDAVARFGSDKMAAFKRWGADQLKDQDDYWFNKETGEVWFYSEKNPALLYGELEAALHRHVATCGRYATIENLALGYGASHGVSGGGSKGCVIRNCDIFWIGGGDHSAGYKQPTRFGNGVEFWEVGEDHLVEGNRFWEVYDVAMSIQGPAPAKIKNIVWRDNIVWRCEQSFEIWYSHPESEVTGVVFEHNTCVDAGFGWSHRQRPNKNGTQLLAYRMESKKIDFTYRDNVFSGGKNYLVWFFNGRLPEFTFKNNVWWQPEIDGVSGEDQNLFRWVSNEGVSFEKYRELTGQDKTARFVEPKFADPQKWDYRILNQTELGGAGARAAK